jgi:hypothetical protein
VTLTPESEFPSRFWTQGEHRITADCAPGEVAIYTIYSAPIATNQSLSNVQKDQGFTFDSRTWGTDPDNDISRVILASEDVRGDVGCQRPPSCTYQPPAGETGGDSFRFLLEDAEGIRSGTATATVRINAPPVATTRGPLTLDALDSGAFLLSELGSDPDPDDSIALGNASSRFGALSCRNQQCTFTAGTIGGRGSVEYTLIDQHGGSVNGSLGVEVILPAFAAVDDTADTPFRTTTHIEVVNGPQGKDIGAGLAIVDNSQGRKGVAVCGTLACDYTPSKEVSGEVDQFEYTVQDFAGRRDTAIVTVNVGENGPPIPQDDELVILRGTRGSVDVLANDSDPEGDLLSVANVSSGEEGDPSCTITVCYYDPRSDDFVGEDVFSYWATDGSTEVRAEVRVLVVGDVNHPPVATNDEAETEPATEKAVDVLLNDFDRDPGDRIRLLEDRTQQPQQGDARCERDTCTYVPAGEAPYTDWFRYVIADQFDVVDTGTVVIGVGEPPRIHPPQAEHDEWVIPSGQPHTEDVVRNDTDEDNANDELTVEGSTQGERGSVSCSGRQCTYTPEPGFAGLDAFTYTVADGTGGIDDGTVTVRVEAVGGPPRTHLELVAPSAPVGASVSARGSGCPAGADVGLSLDGDIVGRGQARRDGSFELDFQVPELDVGRYTVGARCNGVVFGAPLDVVTLTSTPAAASSTVAAVLCFFILIGLAVYQPPFDPAAARRRLARQLHSERLHPDEDAR